MVKLKSPATPNHPGSHRVEFKRWIPHEHLISRLQITATTELTYIQHQNITSSCTYKHHIPKRPTISNFSVACALSSQKPQNIHPQYIRHIYCRSHHHHPRNLDISNDFAKYYHKTDQRWRPNLPLTFPKHKMEENSTKGDTSTNMDTSTAPHRLVQPNLLLIRVPNCNIPS